MGRVSKGPVGSGVGLVGPASCPASSFPPWWIAYLQCEGPAKMFALESVKTTDSPPKSHPKSSCFSFAF